jgi:hypothetical protein
MRDIQLMLRIPNADVFSFLMFAGRRKEALAAEVGCS